ncbi:MAG TPA: FAD-dependent oxidoreductase [Syntrophobacteraceae bacterium]|nr:FAD-dependent oxidoreductase [Syntrophobacteraceae bacterium]
MRIRTCREREPSMRGGLAAGSPYDKETAVTVYDYDIGVIGGGAAGLTVAAGTAQLGAGTLLIDREPRLGGDCLHYGCVPSKTLIRTAHVYHLMRRAAEFGLPSVDLPPPDFLEIARRIRSVIGEIQRHDSVERFCKLGAKVEFGEATFADEHSIRLNGSLPSARHWVVATGSSPAIPAIKGLDETPYLTNREIFSLDRLPRSLIILGGGPIGIEMAQAFARLGTDVRVVESGPRILPRDDRDLTDRVMEVLASEGVRFCLSSRAVEVRNPGGERQVVLEDPNGQRTVVRAEELLVAAGRVANIRGLGLESLGIKFDVKGISVDSRLRTARKHIYAAGDVTGLYQFTHAAGYEGGIVVANTVFRLPRKTDYRRLPWCTYTDPELASIGMNEGMASRAGIEYSVWTEEFEANDRSLAEGARDGKIKLILDAREKALGIQILGPRAGELLGEWVAALNGQVKLTTLASSIHPYPTLGEINKKVVSSYLSPKIFSERIRKGLRLFFNLKGRACGTETTSS